MELRPEHFQSGFGLPPRPAASASSEGDADGRPPSRRDEAPAGSVGASLLAALREGVEPDVKLVCFGAEELPAHRFVLAARCPALKPRLGAGLSRVELPLVPRAVLELAVPFIYSGAGVDDRVPDELLVPLFGAGVVLEMPDLRLACRQELERRLTPANVCTVLAGVAPVHRELRAACIAYAARKGREVAHREELTELGPELLTELAREMAGLLPAVELPAVVPVTASAAQALEVMWQGRWYGATVLETKGELFKVRYDGYGSEWDEWVGPDRVRERGAPPKLLA